MINNIIYLVSLLSSKKEEFLYHEASTIRFSILLKFDVAKLRDESRENKKMTSTNNFHNPLLNNAL